MTTLSRAPVQTPIPPGRLPSSVALLRDPSAMHPGVPTQLLLSPSARIVDGDGPHGLTEHLPGVVGRLRAHGVTPTNRVLLCDTNSMAFVLTFLGLATLGCSIAVIDPDADPDTLRGAIDAVDITIGSSLPTKAGGGPRHLGPAESLHAADANATGSAGHESTMHPPSLHRWAERTDALVLWSSGSTGSPKGLVKSGAGVLANVRRTADTMGYHPDDVFLPVLPLTHQYGLSIVLIAALAGCGLIAAPPGRVAAASRIRLLGRGVTVLDAAPSFYADLLRRRDDPELRRVLEGVRLWCVGGAPLSSTLRQDIKRHFGVDLLDGYGMTETGNLSLATADDPTAAGRALEGVGLEIRDGTGRVAATGELGGIWVRTPDLYAHDLNGHAPSTVDGWWDTGDLGRVDRQGRLEVLGRRKAVHRSGFTIVPCALEARAADHGIAVRVITTPDPQLGHRLTACIEDPDGGGAATWRGRLSRCWAHYELPDRTIVLPRWPRTPTGKPDICALTLLAQRSWPRATPTYAEETR